jgi:HD superfamily phosphohydrolase YqeK
MNKSKYFEKEISLIEDKSLQDFTVFYLDNFVPNYFWKIGASSSGRFHPQFAQGDGGLVRHTKAVVLFAQELLHNSYSYLEQVYKDYVILACIVHDTIKYGFKEFDKTAYSEHAENASERVSKAWEEYFQEYAPQFLLNAISAHMGKWGNTKQMTNIDRCVHTADYVASRNFIDIPQVMTEWKEIFEMEEQENETNHN